MKPRALPLGDKNSVGAKVTKLRKQQRMKQKELLARLQVEAIDISATGLSNLEGQTRSVSAEELRALAKIFNVTMDELFVD